jgi:hypothetical protein
MHRDRREVRPGMAVGARGAQDVEIRAGLRDRDVEAVREGGNEAQVLLGQLDREDRRRSLGVQKGCPLVADVRGAGRARGEDLIGERAVDAGPLGDD